MRWLMTALWSVAGLSSVAAAIWALTVVYLPNLGRGVLGGGAWFGAAVSVVVLVAGAASLAGAYGYARGLIR